MNLWQVAVVTVAFPATPLLLARARICISASHSREDLIKALEVNQNLRILYSGFSIVERDHFCSGTDFCCLKVVVLLSMFRLYLMVEFIFSTILSGYRAGW